MAEPALQLVAELPPPLVERRAASRIPVSFAVSLDLPGGPTIEAHALDISASGLLVRAAVDLPIWSRLAASLPAVEPREVRVVRRDGDRYGCLFARPLEAEELDALLASRQAETGFARLRAEADAPPPQPKRGMLKLWRR